MKHLSIPLVCLLAAAVPAQEGAVSSGHSHPDTRDLQLLTTLAAHVELDPSDCELVFAVERTSVMTVMQGYAVALHCPARNLTIAGLVEDDLTTVEKVSYRYEYPEDVTRLVKFFAEGSGPIIGGLGLSDPALLIGAEKNRAGWTVVLLTGWSGPNNRWDKTIFEGITVEESASEGL